MPPSQLAEKITVKEITNGAELERLIPEWESLWLRCPDATPFQLPDWLYNWWILFGKGGLRVIALRADGRLAGLAPFYLNNEGGEINFIGTGITDYLDLLLAQELIGAGAGLIFKALFRDASGWDECELRNIRETSPVLELKDFDGITVSSRPEVPCPVLKLPASTDDFDSTLSKAYLTRLKRAKKGLEKLGRMEFETAGKENAREFMDAFFRFHDLWWDMKGEDGGLRCGEIKEFHRRVAEGFCARGILRLYGMRLNGELRSVVYGFASRGRFYSYLGGYDPALEKHSPGAVLIWHAIKESIRDGLCQFDFLRGGEGYKYLWGARDRMNYMVRMKRVYFHHGI